MSDSPTMKEEPLTPEDRKKLGLPPEQDAIRKALDQQQKVVDAEADADAAYSKPKTEESSLPDWVKIPSELQLPKGRRILAMRFRADWTETPEKGDRQCVLWTLTEADEKLAFRRTRGESQMAINELSKQMIRAVDGKRVDWTGGDDEASIQLWWNEIGMSCRTLVKNAYAKLHTLEAAQLVDFFTNCQVVRTVR